MNSYFASELVWRLSWMLLHSVWQLTLAALAVKFLLAVTPRSAPLRYALACGGMAAMYVPLGATFLMAPPAPQTMLQAHVTANGGQMAVPEIRRAAAASETFARRTPRPGASTANFATELQAWQDRGASVVASAATPWIPAAWAGGVALLSIWNLGGWFVVQRLRQTAQPVDHDELRHRVAALAQRLGVSQSVRLLASVRVDTPVMIGWLRPVILLPASLFSNLSPAELEALLAHELAHIRRQDYLANLLQTLTETLLFFHPAVWWLSRQARIEREFCCDDRAVSVCGRKLDYAKALAAIEKSRAAPRLALAARGHESLLRQRVRRVLYQAPCRRTSWFSGGACAALFLVVCLAGVLSLSAADPLQETKPQNADSPDPASAADFQPVQQRTLSINGDRTSYLNLTSGLMAEQKTMKDPIEDAPTQLPATDGAYVAFARREERLFLHFYNVYAARTENDSWNTTTAHKIREDYRRGGFAIVPGETNVLIPLDGPLPITIYLGNTGLLQVTQVSKGETPEATIQYKLAPPGRPVDQTVSDLTLPKGLEFLKPFREFCEFRFGQDEATIRKIAARRKLRVVGSAEQNFAVQRHDGETLVLSMREGKCVGIQLLRLDSAAEPRAFAQAPAVAENAKREPAETVRQIFEPTTRGSGKTSWSSLFSTTVNGVKQRMMLVHAYRGDRWPVTLAGQTKPLFHVELFEGDDHRVELKIIEAETTHTLTLRRDETHKLTLGGKEFRLRYPTTTVEGREPPHVDYAVITVNLNEDESEP
jgi:beta-lactamase regulating signal transducer with metallopeptidase domain